MMEVFWGLIFLPANFLGFVGSHRDFFGFQFFPPFDQPRHFIAASPTYFIKLVTQKHCYKCNDYF